MQDLLRRMPGASKVGSKARQAHFGVTFQVGIELSLIIMNPCVTRRLQTAVLKRSASNETIRLQQHFPSREPRGAGMLG